MSQKSIRSTAMNYGLVMGAITILIYVIQYVSGDFSVTNRNGDWVFGSIGFIAGIVIPVLGIVAFKKSNGGYIKFGEAFRMGFSIFIYAALLDVVWRLVYMLILEPGYIDIELAFIEEQTLKYNPNMTDSQLEQMLELQEKWFLPPVSIVIMTILGSAFVGAIISVILAAIIKKNKPEHLVAAEAEAEGEG